MALEDRHRFQERCSRCSQCKFVPAPASHEFSSACPSIDYGNFHAYSGGGKVVTSYALQRGAAGATAETIDSVYACTMCGACDISCKTNMGDDVEPLDTIYDLRAHMAKAGHLPPALMRLIEATRRDGTHIAGREGRARWAEGLGIKDATREKAGVFFYIGAENACDEGQWPQLRALVAAMRAAGVDFAIAHDAEDDSGALAFDLGDLDLARALALRVEDQVRKAGASTLLTASASAYAAFRSFYPRMGVELGAVRILHTSEFMVELTKALPAPPSARAPIKVTYHDPCKLGRLSEPFKPWRGKVATVMNTLHIYDPPRPQRFGGDGVYDAPRQLLSDIDGVELVEMERNREFAFCCGAGAGVPKAYPEMAEMAAVSRLNEACRTGASHLVTSCGGCQRHLADVARRNGIAIEVCGLFDLVPSAGTQGDAE